MRPLNSRFFGQTGIQIKFWSGSAVITGYIVKQTGSNRYVVSNDAGSVTDTVYLQEATVTGQGQAQILVTNFAGGTEHAYSISTNLVKTFEDNVYAWVLGSAPADAQHAELPQNS
jgi:hypothetical protein